MKINELPVLESTVNELDPLTAGDLSDEDSVKSAILNAHWINPINPGLLALELTLGEGVFHPPPFHNSFVFKVRLLKFCTELLSDRINNLRERKSESNQQ